MKIKLLNGFISLALVSIFLLGTQTQISAQSINEVDYLKIRH